MNVSCEAHRRSLWTSHPAAANHSPTKRSGFKPPPCSFSPCPQWVGNLELPGLRALVCRHQMLARVPSAKDRPRSRGSQPRQALREPVSPPTEAPHDCRSVLVLCDTQARRPRLRGQVPPGPREPPSPFGDPRASSYPQPSLRQGHSWAGSGQSARLGTSVLARVALKARGGGGGGSEPTPQSRVDTCFLDRRRRQ